MMKIFTAWMIPKSNFRRITVFTKMILYQHVLWTGCILWISCILLYSFQHRKIFYKKRFRCLIFKGFLIIEKFNEMNFHLSNFYKKKIQYNVLLQIVQGC